MRLLLFVLASVLLVVQASAATKADLAVEALCNDQQRRLNPPAPKCGVDSNMGGNYTMYPGRSPIVQFDVRACTSYWDIGYATGRRFSTMIQTRLYVHMQRQLLWFNSSTSGQDLIPRLAAHSARRYPDYFQELCGLAAGAGVQYGEMVLNNYNDELSLMLATKEAWWRDPSQEAALNASGIFKPAQNDAEEMEAAETGPAAAHPSAGAADAAAAASAQLGRRLKAAGAAGDAVGVAPVQMRRQLRMVTDGRPKALGREFVSKATHDGMGCSDVLIAGPREGNITDPARTRVPLLAHNEEESASREGALYMLIGTSGGATWVGYCYAGELCSIGNGWNSYGLAFTENYVEPAYRPFVGTGLVFLGRSLLEARDVPDALVRLAQPDVMMGVNFNLLDRIGEGGGSIGSAEVGPFGAFAYHQVAAGEWQFHANQYTFMDIVNYPSKISKARADTALAFPGMPLNVSDALSILGDTSTNPALPIFFEPTYNKEDITTGTVLFSPAVRPHL
uniref:Peptidase C45 hydrolase domain-containing protein n=1 Tax=Tetradesmus obliquus TaxID=3088 RepID=A0A383VWE1_TETOB|eukprot:jgi/Sobl393_1/19651/SZX69230.1